jgi:hypothetical protein
MKMQQFQSLYTPFNSSLLNSIAFDVSFQLKPKFVAILDPFFPNVVDCFKLMSFAPHATFELREVNYNRFCIKNVPCIPTTFDGDVLFELPLINNPDCHFGQMQGMDKKYDGHFLCKVKTTNIKNYFDLTFRKIGVWVIWNVETSYIVIWRQMEPLMKLLGLVTLFMT